MNTRAICGKEMLFLPIASYKVVEESFCCQDFSNHVKSTIKQLCASTKYVLK